MVYHPPLHLFFYGSILHYSFSTNESVLDGRIEDVKDKSITKYGRQIAVDLLKVVRGLRSNQSLATGSGVFVKSLFLIYFSNICTSFSPK